MKKNFVTPSNEGRRDFLKNTSALVGASSLGGLGALAANPVFAGGHGGLADGMTGGPTGFEGAERFQYNTGMSEGRCIEGINNLPADKKPAKLTMLLTDGAIGQITKPFPVGKVGPLGPFPEGAPSVKEVWEKETGIEIDIIGAPAEDIFKLLTEKPNARGLSVPGMPIGSPGMEMGNNKEPFETLVVFENGKTQIFNSHAQRPSV